jgi:hypothetical protein
MVGKAQKLHGVRSGQYGRCSDGVPLISFSMPGTEFNLHLVPRDFWAFLTMKGELWGKKFQSDQHSTAHFREVGGAL